MKFHDFQQKKRFDKRNTLKKNKMFFSIARLSGKFIIFHFSSILRRPISHLPID